jgi:hypothetical protein
MARLLAVILLVQAAVGGSAPPSTLDYASFKTRVLPLLVERCARCHSTSTAFRLQPLPPGRRAYTEEEARRNFEAAAGMVVPGVPLRSPLLTMPLAHAAGGTDSHTGGKLLDITGRSGVEGIGRVGEERLRRSRLVATTMIVDARSLTRP